MKTVTMSLSICLASAAGAPALAQNYPDRQISIVVPFATGGPTDTSARIVASALAARTGSTFIVENVPGAGATIGATKVAQAKPDGYTLLWGSGSSLAMTPHLYANLKYDAIKSFTPVGSVVAQPFVLVVKQTSGIRTVQDLVARAKASPGKLNFPSAGQGSSTHLVAELFKNKAGIFAVHVPYNGGAPATNALLAGDVDFFFDTPTTTVPMVRAGRLVALAVTSKTRWPDLPDVPTLAELGYRDFDATTWFGLVAPAGTPPDRIAYLNQHLNAVIALPEVSNALKQAGFVIEPSTPAEFGQRIASETDRWGVIIRNAKVKLN